MSLLPRGGLCKASLPRPELPRRCWCSSPKSISTSVKAPMGREKPPPQPEKSFRPFCRAPAGPGSCPFTKSNQWPPRAQRVRGWPITAAFRPQTVLSLNCHRPRFFFFPSSMERQISHSLRRILATTSFSFFRAPTMIFACPAAAILPRKPVPRRGGNQPVFPSDPPRPALPTPLGPGSLRNSRLKMIQGSPRAPTQQIFRLPSDFSRPSCAGPGAPGRQKIVDRIFSNSDGPKKPGSALAFRFFEPRKSLQSLLLAPIPLSCQGAKVAFCLPSARCGSCFGPEKPGPPLHLSVPISPPNPAGGSGNCFLWPGGEPPPIERMGRLKPAPGAPEKKQPPTPGKQTAPALTGGEKVGPR